VRHGSTAILEEKNYNDEVEFVNGNTESRWRKTKGAKQMSCLYASQLSKGKWLCYLFCQPIGSHFP
jgi:hypothetical protein